MSYFPCDIPFMSDDELKETGIHIPKNLSNTNVGNIEYIRREDAICLIKHYLDNPPNNHSQLFISGMEDAYYRMLSNLNNLPPADVAPVVHGRWVKYTGMGKEQWMCSECSAEEKNPKIARYCYYCGAKMDG